MNYRFFSSIAFSVVSVTSFTQSNYLYAQENLESVVVTATRTANDLVSAPASVSVITSADIEAMTSLNLNEIVSQAVGVESTKDGGRAGREFIKVRGMDSSFTLILLNGRRMSSSNAIVRGNDFDYSTIPPASIERIEIIRGPMSSLYGSDALGGVINIITKKPDNEWINTINVNYSSPDSDGGEKRQLGLNTGGAIIENELYLNLAVNHQHNNAWTPFSENDPSGRDRQKVTAAENRESNNMLAGVYWLIAEGQEVNVDIGYSADNRDGSNETSRRISPFDASVSRFNLSLTHSAQWEWGDTRFNYGYERVSLEEGIDDIANITERNQVVELSATQTLDSHRITYGGDTRVTDLESARDLLETGNASIDQQALFLQDEWSLNDRLTLTIGGRVDLHKEFGSHFSPRVYLVNKINKNWVVKGGFGQAFRAPSLLRLNEEYRLRSCRGSCYIIGNPNLSPETSDNYELTAIYQAKDWTSEISVFTNFITDLIERDLTTPVGEQDARTVYTYQNVNKARVNGIELSNVVGITSDLNMRVNYTYIDAKNRSDQTTLLERPKHSFSTRLSWQISEDLMTFFDYKFTGKQAIDNNQTLDSYFTLDLGLNFFYANDTQIKAGITNATNEAFDDDASLLGYNQSPRTIYIGATHQF